MSLLSRLRDSFATNNIDTKLPQSIDPIVITNFNSNNKHEDLVDSLNYLDQYILYTYKAIDYKSSSIAEKEIQYWHDINGDKDLLDRKDPLLHDLYAFNPWMSLYDARKLLHTHLDLTGSAFWLMSNEDLHPDHKKVEFYPLDPTKVEIDTDRYGLPQQFIYEDGDGHKQGLDTNDVIYFRNVSHKNWIKGYSPVEAIRNVHNAFSYGSEHNMNQFANDGRFDFLMFVDGINEPQRKALEVQLREKYTGTRNAKRSGVVRFKPEIIKVSDNNKELDYVEGMKMLRQDVLAMLGIPEALLFPSATNSNTSEARRMFQQDTVLPAIKREYSVYNEQLISKYYNSRRIDKTQYYFEAVNVIDIDEKALSETITLQYEKGIITRNEARELLGQDPVNDGDTFATDSTIAPIEPPMMDDTDVDEDNDDMKSLRLDIAEIKAKGESREKNVLNTRDILRKQVVEEHDNAEQQVRSSVDSYLLSQGVSIINNIGDNIPTLKSLFNKSDENERALNYFTPVMQGVVSQVVDSTNIEIKQKLLQAKRKELLSFENKSLTSEGLEQIDKQVQEFTQQINKTTQKDLSKILTESKTSLELKQGIADQYNGYLEGATNVKTLKSYGVYVDRIAITEGGGAVVSSANRYNAMLEQITREIKGDDQKKALTALKGILDPNDPIAQSVNSILSTIYGIKDCGEGSFVKAVGDGDCAHKDYRSGMISRTQTNQLRNMAFDLQYSDNPLVKGKEWVAALQPGVTRDWHLAADGQVVPIGDNFIVNGEKLAHPGDTSHGASADNIINCRCRIVAVI